MKTEYHADSLMLTAEAKRSCTTEQRLEGSGAAKEIQSCIVNGGGDFTRTTDNRSTDR
jgi:hypothetical protein